ncbi:MAG: helix-turn-helix domain-containing protein [Spirochaetaceae bacterium]|jgi:transcriptional regulator with XRE-family HTH domain|nr:helix-turn-helix domain-containing protein [Spirochaetaceae bacterium]
MIPPVNERLKAVRTALKLSQRDFSKGIYTAQSVYARMETGENKVNNRVIALVCYTYGVNEDFLREGKPPVFSGTPDTKIENLYKIFNELNSLFQDYLIIQAKELLKVQNQQEGEKSNCQKFDNLVEGDKKLC